jgi:beta-lactam-binding protein with PASTA domain
VTQPTVSVPDVRELSATIAAHTIQAAGLVPKFTGTQTNHSWVFSQSPTAGHIVAKGSTVTMALRNTPLP